MVYITHIRQSGGNGHEHIIAVQWRDPTTGKIDASMTARMVQWIGSERGEARVRDRSGHDVQVGVVNAPRPYLRTYADRIWTDNLLALPPF